MRKLKIYSLSVLLVLGLAPVSLAQTFTFTNGHPFSNRWFAKLLDDQQNVIATNWDSLVIPNSSSANAVINSGSAELSTEHPDAQNGVVLNSLSVGPNGFLLVRNDMDLVGSTPLVNQGSIAFSPAGGRTFSFSNNVVNSGTFEVTVVQGAPNQLLLTNAGATLQGGGQLILGGNGPHSHINGPAGGLLTIADQTIEGFGKIGLGNLEIVNTVNGLILANSPNGFALQVDTGPGGMVNDSIMRAEDGGLLFIFDSIVNNTNGLIHADVGSEVELEDTTIIGGRLTGDGDYLVDHGTTIFDNVEFDSTLFVSNVDTLVIVGTLDNSGIIETSNQLALLEVAAGGATLDGGGTIVLGNQFVGDEGETLTIEDQTILLTTVNSNLGANSINIINTAGGVIEADNHAMVDPFGSNPWTNDGTLRIVTDNRTMTIPQSLVNNGIMDAREGTIRVNADSLTSSAGSLLMGGGTLRSNVEINVAGVVAPGNSVGALTLDGEVSFGPTADLQIELASSSSFDVLSISGNLDSLDGTLDLSLLEGFVPDPSDTFTILSTSESAQLMGEFSNVADGARLTTSDGSGSFQVNYVDGNSSSVILSDFQPILPLPATTAAVVQGILTSGTVADLLESDDVDMVFIRNPARTAGIVEVEVEASTTVFNPTSFAFTVEASAFFRSTIIESVVFFDYDAGEFVEIGSWPASRFADGVATVSGAGDLARFVDDSTGSVKSRILFTSAVHRQKFSAAIDQVFWSID